MKRGAPGIRRHAGGILVPISFSGCSVGTYRFNFGFTGSFSTRIVLLRICFAPVCTSSLPCKSMFGCRVDSRRAIGGMLRGMRSSLGALSRGVGRGMTSKRFPSIGCAYILHRNVPRRRVLECGGRRHPEVVVVNAQNGGRGSVSLVNDMATRVVRHDRAAILTVPRGAPFGHFGRIGQVTFVAGFSRHSLVTFSSFVGKLDPFRFSISLVRLSSMGSA